MSSPKKYPWTTSKVATKQHETPGQAIPHNSRKLHWAYRCDGEGLMEITWVGLSGWWLLTLRNLTCMYMIYLKKVGFFCMSSLFLLAYTWKKHLFFGRLYRDYHEIHVWIIYNCTHLCFCSFFVNSYNPNGYLLAWNNPKRSQQRNGLAIAVQGIQLVSSYEVGPVTSYKWNYRD